LIYNEQTLWSAFRKSTYHLCPKKRSYYEFAHRTLNGHGMFNRQRSCHFLLKRSAILSVVKRRDMSFCLCSIAPSEKSRHQSNRGLLSLLLCRRGIILHVDSEQDNRSWQVGTFPGSPCPFGFLQFNDEHTRQAIPKKNGDRVLYTRWVFHTSTAQIIGGPDGESRQECSNL
jgi:hypothetical protein